MKTFKIGISALVFATAFALSGCDTRSDEQKQRDNAYSLSNPEIVGQTPDGRLVYHSTITVSSSSYAQEIYFVGSDVTTNRIQETGSGKSKSRHTEVTAYLDKHAQIPDVVILNGQRLDPNEVQQALTRDEDARRAEERK